MSKMRRNLIKIKSCAIFNGLGFLVTLSSINVFVFDWLVRKGETFSLLNSLCLRNKVKLVCDLRVSVKGGNGRRTADGGK